MKGIKFKCSFCNKEFNLCSDCATHIENESDLNICLPSDIIIIHK